MGRGREEGGGRGTRAVAEREGEQGRGRCARAPPRPPRMPLPRPSALSATHARMPLRPLRYSHTAPSYAPTPTLRAVRHCGMLYIGGVVYNGGV
eukprot:1451383-Rhodomonas_salina.3